MSNKKKILFYSILLPGHINVCAAIGTNLLNNHPDKVEVYFVVDHSYEQRLKELDARFKIHSFTYEREDTLRTTYMIDRLEACLQMNLVDKTVLCWKMFVEDDLLIEGDEKTQRLIEEIRPDFILADQNFHLPALLLSKVPWAFICSYNPLFFALDGYPLMGSDARLDEPDRIEQFNREFAPHRLKIQERMHEILRQRGAIYENRARPIDQIINDATFNIMVYPAEVDYFSEEVKRANKLWAIDSVLSPERIPAPYKLPEEFARIPLPVVYVSLGSLFSSYTYLMQRLLNMLEKFPAKFIVSKGSRGDQLKFPSDRFIGENFLDQLAVLQISDAMITHGGNGSFCELFFFGVPCLVLPIIVDQINNSTRVEETGYGFKLNILRYEQQELFDKLTRILEDNKIRQKWKAASERIRAENRISKVVDQIVDYVCGSQTKYPLSTDNRDN